MENMEFKMTTNLAAEIPQQIGFNYDQLKAELAERLDRYKGIVVTEDTIREAKADRATLNKLKTAIDARRKDVKKAYMAPFDDFEKRCKELTALIDEPIKLIDNQLAGFEQTRREEKMKQIREAYAACIDHENQEIIPLERIADQRWLNATATMKSVEDKLKAWNDKVTTECQVLNSVDQEYAAAVRQKYIETLDVAKALAHVDALKASKEAFIRQQEERAAREAERAEKAKLEAQTSAQAPQQETPQQAPQPKIYKLALEFNVTREQAIELKKFLDQAGITYRKIS